MGAHEFSGGHADTANKKSLMVSPDISTNTGLM